jgi:hypothetical protein
MAAASHPNVTASACPDTAATALARPEGPESSVRNRLPNVATPTAWPSWIVVVSSPLASAACASGTRTRACVTSGLKPSASAAPVMISAVCSARPPCPPECSTSATQA